MQNQFSQRDDLDLTRFDTLYRSDSATDRTFHPGPVIPDGRYEAVITEAILMKSQRGTPMVRWTLRLIGSTFRDRILRKHRPITEKTLEYLRRELEICGLRLAQFSELRDRIREMEGVELEITKSTKGTDFNIYFNRALSSNNANGGLIDDELPF